MSARRGSPARQRRGRGRIVAELRAEAAAFAVGALTRTLVSAASPPWRRENYRGRQVDLSGGVAMVAGLLCGATGARTSGRVKASWLAAVAGAGAFGMLDDLRGDGSSKGLAGHLGELRQGHVTTGALKIAGIGASALLAAVLVPPTARTRTGRCADIVMRAGVIAGSANVVNLLDLRPGRAIKACAAPAALVTAAGGEAAGLGAATLGSAVACLDADLAERAMLGDCGANALGAALGAAAVVALPRPAQAAVLAALVGLTLTSERVSFSRVIDENPWLAAVDAWGRTE